MHTSLKGQTNEGLGLCSNCCRRQTIPWQNGPREKYICTSGHQSMTGVLYTVCLSLGAGVIYLDLYRSAMPIWILREAREACSHQTTSVGHCTLSSLSLTWLAFGQWLQVQWAAVFGTLKVYSFPLIHLCRVDSSTSNSLDRVITIHVYGVSGYCAFDIFQKVVFCLTLYIEEVNLQTFVMI